MKRDAKYETVRIDHLGIVSGISREIGLVETIDEVIVLDENSRTTADKKRWWSGVITNGTHNVVVVCGTPNPNYRYGYLDSKISPAHSTIGGLMNLVRIRDNEFVKYCKKY